MTREAEALAEEAWRSLVVCADDYGMNAGVSQGILDLAAAGRVSATSCMTNAPDWPEFGRRLGGVAIGTGLHLTLTWGRPLGPMPIHAPGGVMPALGRVLARSLAGMLPVDEIVAEIERQLDAFRVAAGREPDFVDGHQHVHVLPGIRGALLAALKRRGLAGRAWLRDPGEPVAAILSRRVATPKAILVATLASGFRDAATLAGFATNNGFSGFSPFDPTRDVGDDFGRHLISLGPRPVLMCHPGRRGAGDDEIGPARRCELDYLSSPTFAELLDRERIRLVRSPV